MKSPGGVGVHNFHFESWPRKFEISIQFVNHSRPIRLKIIKRIKEKRMEIILEAASSLCTKYKPTCTHNVNRDTNIIIEYSQRIFTLPARNSRWHHETSHDQCCSLITETNKVNVRIIKHSYRSALVTSLSLIAPRNETVSKCTVPDDLCQHLYARPANSPLKRIPPTYIVALIDTRIFMRTEATTTSTRRNIPLTNTRPRHYAAAANNNRRK